MIITALPLPRISPRFVLLGLLALNACAGSAPPRTFDLIAPQEVASSGKGRALLVVAEPSALQALDTMRILVTTRGNGLAYLPDAQWADRLPKLFQARLIQSFENGRRLQAIGRPGDGLVPAAQLNTDIRRFGYDEASGEAVIEMSVKIINDRTGRILAATLLTSRVPVAGNDAESVSAALDAASQSLLRDIVAWVSTRI